eukprot:1157273-Pelagomonas_calceolata.AAC.4
MLTGVHKIKPCDHASHRLPNSTRACQPPPFQGPCLNGRRSQLELVQALLIGTCLTMPNSPFPCPTNTHAMNRSRSPFSYLNAMVMYVLVQACCSMAPCFLCQAALSHQFVFLFGHDPQVGAEFAPQEVANTLWALARLGAKPPAPTAGCPPSSPMS